MRIGTRLTLTAALLVAATLGTYGVVTLRSRRGEREEQLEKQARELALVVSSLVEAQGFTELAANADPLRRALAAANVPWDLRLIDARELPPPDAPPSGDARRERLRKAVAIKGPITQWTVTGGRRELVYLEPVRAPAPLTADGFRVVGIIELTRQPAYLDDEMDGETQRMVASILLLIAVLVAAVSLTARRTISRPIAKLLAGIDDVTKGDLSGVLLQERDDEIGALAARFNVMTASLREARAETRRSLDQLRRTDKLATIGRVAAEIAHEVGTPLNVVSGRARALGKKADDADAVRKNASIIAEQATRIARIIQRLLDYARRRIGTEKAPVSLNRLAEDTLEFIEHQLANARIDLRLQLAADLEAVPADRDQLQQVLLNLYMNAIQAMPEGGILEVRTGRVSRRRPGLQVAPEQAYAYLAVADTGVGIPEADRDKIFDPFYTSKATEGGTGLGLAVAKGIVDDHDGWIELDAHPGDGDGTEFRVFLPLAEAHAADEGPSGPGPDAGVA